MTGHPGTAEVGARLRRTRLARGMTLMDVQTAAGVSTAHVSEIERGQTSPTIFTLERVATALGIDVAELLAPERDAPVVVVPALDRARYRLAGGLVLEPLSTGRRATSISAFQVRLAPGASGRPRPARPFGEEIVEISTGRLLVRSDSEEIELTEGEGVHLMSDGGLQFENPALDDETNLLWFTSPALVL